MPSKTRSRARAYETLRLLAATLDAVRFGVMAISGEGEVVACNNAARRLLGVSEAEDGGKIQLAQLLASLAHAGVTLLDGGGARFRNGDGAMIEIQATPLAHGLALVIEDVSAVEERAWDNQIVTAEYESLFMNAVCGIYRDRLDSTPVRCNPALARLNGYQNEGEYIAAVTGSHGQWYVDPDRSEEFKKHMREEGRVRDFVSEVYRHRTRERFWITENAWYVRDPDGNPLFIEGTIQDATERVATLSVIERQANFDNLTGVASRFRFFNEMERCGQRVPQGCTLYSIDLDGFKDVNDMMGHAAGDHVLQAAAERLTAIAGDDALVARLGGDEFAILAMGEPNETRARSIARQIVQAMLEPIAYEGRTAVIGASIGIAMSPPSAATAEELLRDADLALYEAKAAGRNGFRIFDAELRHGIEARKEYAQELLTAIERGEIDLHYQPIANGASGEIESVEALLRWNHPTRGLLIPQQFVPDAEDAGVMTALGHWVLRKACEQAAALPEDLRVSVNLSSSEMLSPAIARDIADILAATDLAPQRLIIEVTESAILASEDVAGRVLADIKALGVAVSLDDFGTAYCSLSYLKRFAFDQVKIDRTFVGAFLDQPASAAIVRAVIGIGRDLGIEVVAEGVETQAIADALKLEGCKTMQGYHFGTPKPFADMVSDLAVSRLATRLTEARDFGARLAEALALKAS